MRNSNEMGDQLTQDGAAEAETLSDWLNTLAIKLIDDYLGDEKNNIFYQRRLNALHQLLNPKLEVSSNLSDLEDPLGDEKLKLIQTAIDEPVLKKNMQAYCAELVFTQIISNKPIILPLGQFPAKAEDCILIRDILVSVISKLSPIEWLTLRQVSRQLRDLPYPWHEIGAKSANDYRNRLRAITKCVKACWDSHDHQGYSRTLVSRRLADNAEILYLQGIVHEHGFELPTRLGNAPIVITPTKLTLALRGYLPLENTRGEEDQLQRGSQEHARKLLLKLFDERLLLVNWKPFTKTPMYLHQIIDSSYQNIESIVSAFRKGHLTQQSLEQMDESITTFVLSEEGLAVLANALADVRNTTNVDSLLNCYLIYKYKDRLAELDQSGFLPKEFVPKFSPTVVKFFLGISEVSIMHRNEIKMMRGCMFTSLKKGTFSHDDLIKLAGLEDLLNCYQLYNIGCRLALVVKGYLPIRGWLKFTDCHNKNDKSEHLLALFNEDLLQSSQIICIHGPKFNEVPKYIRCIFKADGENIENIMSAFRSRLVTQHLLNAVNDEMATFLLSTEGLKSLRNQWFTWDEVRVSHSTDPLLRCYLTHEYEVQLAELDQNGILPSSYVSRLAPKIVKIFVNNGMNRDIQKNLYDALEKGCFTLDDLVQYASLEKLNTLLWHYKPELMTSGVFTFQDAMALEEYILSNVLLYLSQALFTKTIMRQDIPALVEFAKRGLRYDNPFMHLCCLLKEADTQQALEAGSITVAQITALPNIHFFEMLIEGHSEGKSLLAKKIITPQQAAALSDHRLMWIISDEKKLKEYEIEVGYAALKRNLTVKIGHYLTTPLTFYRKEATLLQTAITEATFIADIEQLINQEIGGYQPNANQRSNPQFFSDRAQHPTLQKSQQIHGSKWSYHEVLKYCQRLLNSYNETHQNLVVLHEAASRISEKNKKLELR